MTTTSLVFVALLASPILAQNWATYPQVPKTASINGFADPIFAKLPECAQECVRESTGNTPCPYWDTGCLCIMPQWINPVADCFAKNCKGSPVESAVSLANSLCTSVGAWWSVGAAESTLLASAIGDAAAATSTPASEEAKPTSTGATAAPAGAASSAPKAEGTESNASTKAAPAATTTPASQSAAPTGTSGAASSRKSSARGDSSPSSKPPSVSNSGSVATFAVAGAVVAIVAQLI